MISNHDLSYNIGQALKGCFDDLYSVLNLN